MSKDVYIAAPLFNHSERLLNEEIAAILDSKFISYYLPQKDGGQAADRNTVRSDLFRKDVEAIEKCKLMICVLDGRVPDEGTCFEMGMAYALDKPVIVYWSDDRNFMDGHLNVMLEHGGTDYARDMDELVDYIDYWFHDTGLFKRD